MIAVRRMSVAPSEFWHMEPRHFWFLMDDLLAEQAALAGRAGRMTDDEKDELLAVMRAEGMNI